MKHTTYLTIASVLFLGGCMTAEQFDQRAQIGQFEPDDQPRSIHAIAEAQANAGAWNDAMLRLHHFQGTALTTLGAARLNEMARHHKPEWGPMVVYLHTPGGDDLLEARRAAVADYLQGLGLTGQAVELRTGPNPHRFVPAADQIPALQPSGGQTEPTVRRAGL